MSLLAEKSALSTVIPKLKTTDSERQAVLGALPNRKLRALRAFHAYATDRSWFGQHHSPIESTLLELVY